MKRHIKARCRSLHVVAVAKLPNKQESLARTTTSICLVQWKTMLACLVTCLFVGALFAEPRRPNVEFFLADVVGQRDVGCYGSQYYETPRPEDVWI